MKTLKELTIKEYSANVFYLYLDGASVAGPFTTRAAAFDRGEEIEQTPGAVKKLRLDLAR